MVQKDCLRNKILIICGPTASGKSALAIECAKLLKTEIISADSMNVYQNLDIGTAKPTIAEREGIIHHIIDVADEFSNFTVSDYRSLAKPIVDRLLSENKTPIICGGTGFYINSILYDLSYGESKGNLEVRNYYKNLAEKNGNEYVYNILKEKDPESADKLHFNDLKRVIRALEICESGKKKSEIKDDFKPIYDYDAYMIDMDRDLLYERINNRVDKMVEQGLIDEVKSLIDKGVTIDNQCMQGIGYKEIYSYLTGEVDLNSAIETLKLNTRHYAKRQITFFKRLPNLKMIKLDDVKKMAQGIIENL